MRASALAFAPLLAFACSSPGSSPAAPGSPDAPNAPGAPASASSTPDAPPAASPPVAPPRPQGTPVATVTGAEEIVFDWGNEHCEALDLPDVPANAVHTKDGKVLLQAGDAPRNYFSVGPDLSSVHRRCTPPGFVSGADPSVTAFTPYQWVGGIYRVGDVIHALVHDEYHDPSAPNCLAGDLSPANPCWYNFISYASSIDDGLTFTQPAAPANLVAPFPFVWNPTHDTTRPNASPPPEGYMGPSNVLHAQDGYYYATIGRVDPTGVTKGVCVMRTNDLGAPASWRAWSGTAFDLAFANPYAAPIADPSAALCTTVSPDAIGSIHSTLRYSTYYQRYIIVGGDVLVDPADGILKCGAWFSLSDDLVTWDRARLVLEADFGYPTCRHRVGAPRADYPAVLDPSDTSINFENVGQHAYLYYTTAGYVDAAGVKHSQGPDGGWDSDLVRVPISFDVLP